MERTIGPNQNQVFSCTELHVQRFNLSPPQISQKISQRSSPTNISLIGGISFFGEISTVSLSVRYHSACSGKISSTPASPWSKFFARSNCTIAWKIANYDISAFLAPAGAHCATILHCLSARSQQNNFYIRANPHPKMSLLIFLEGYLGPTVDDVRSPCSISSVHTCQRPCHKHVTKSRIPDHSN